MVTLGLIIPNGLHNSTSTSLIQSIWHRHVFLGHIEIIHLRVFYNP
jgi:hypothetical protein